MADGEMSRDDWYPIASGDPDLFLEIIRAEETQDYLMQIAEFLNIYHAGFIPVHAK